MHEPSQAPRFTPPKLSTRQQVTLLGGASVGALAILFGIPALGHLLAPKAPPPPPPPAAGTFRPTHDELATLSLMTVQATGFVSRFETEGKIATNDDRTTPVYSPYSGRVTRVFAKMGDAVSAGQPLFAIEASEFAQAQSDLVAATAQLGLTKAAEARQRELYKINGAALKDWQQSQSDLANAQAGLAAVRNRLKILGKSETEIAAMEAGGPARSGSAETIVRAPIGGIVIQRAVGVGQNLGSVTNGGASPAFLVSDLSTVWLVGQLREVDSPLARVGQPVEVRVAALPGQVFAAKVDFVSPTVDPVTRRVMVRAAISNPGGALKPEMFASFSLATGGQTSAVGAPESAVIFEGDTARVWVSRPGGLLELRSIKTGEVQNGMVEVTAGLAPGERIVTRGALFIDRASKSD